MQHRVFIRKDERGAIEGLPLQLMIAVIVAGIALAIGYTGLALATSPSAAASTAASSVISAPP